MNIHKLTSEKYTDRIWKLVLGISIIILITTISYIPAMNGGYIWDDDDYLTENTTLRSMEGLRQIWFKIGAVPQYYPLVHTMFWIEYHLWGLAPLGYHIVNVLLHTLNALLLWWILRYLSIPGDWFVALIFAIHPVHVESVAWITERKNVLSGLFYLSSVLLYLKFLTENARSSNDSRIAKLKAKKRNRKRSHNRGLKLYILSFILFICALLSKTVSVTMPAAILLVIWWKRKKIEKIDAIRLLPFFLIGGALSIITIWMEKNIVGAEGQEWALNFFERSLIAGRVVWFYIIKLVLPYDLTFNYPRWEIDDSLFWQYLYPLSAVVGILVLWRFSKKIGKGPLVATLYFIMTLIPALGFFDVFPMRYSYVADHFQYHASIGIIILLASGMTSIMKKRTRIYQIAGIVFFTGTVTAFAAITWQQGHVYKNLETLWRDTLSKNPKSWMAHTHLGTILYERGEYEKAIEHHKMCITINPRYDGAYNSLGRVYHKLGMTDEAIQEYKNALRTNPRYYRAHNNIGVIYEEKGLYKRAVAEYKKAILIKPNYDIAHCNLGNTFLKMGFMLRAIQAYRIALNMNPSNQNARQNIEVVYKNMVNQYNKKIQADPSDVKSRYDLGLAHAIKNDLRSAVKEWREVLKIDPNHREAYASINRALEIIKRSR